jgi:glycosyltransferase involved in cell wall biosynthesis
MRVLFVSRKTLFSSPGGDTVQILKTKEYLGKLGVLVDLDLDGKANPGSYDLVHFFNLIRPDDLLWRLPSIKRPIVISPIYIDYSESERECGDPKRRILSMLLGKYGVEYSKVILRTLVGNDPLKSWQYLLKGHRRSIASLLSRCDMLLPNSKSEYLRLSSDFPSKIPCRVVPNGVDVCEIDEVLPTDAEREMFSDAIICVGRIEHLKNQVRLVNALRSTDKKLFIIGKAASNQGAYAETFRNAASRSGNAAFLGPMAHRDVIAIMKCARVHALPSYFETTGLVSIEAAYAGANIVISDRGDQLDYFRDIAFFCDPGSEKSIREAVLSAYDSEWSPETRNRIRECYTWDMAAQVTLRAYEEVLAR